MGAKGNTYRNIAIGVIVILVLIQFIRPDRNLTDESSKDITKKYAVPANVQAVLKTACYDCHSNHTNYLWYFNVQPLGWWLTHHINEGKEELNFNEFAGYRIGKQYHKLDGIVKQLDKNEMPLASYTLIHKDAILSNEQRALVSNWAAAIRDSIKAAYPADSLARPKRGPH